MQQPDYDLFIIGGGINGCGIARDAAGRGYSVFLAEMNDLASGTSSWSSKLIHGGLRYLEHYEFRLVREALREREVLWQIAPHIVKPMRFILPLHKGMRPAWLLRLGLFLYDHIGGRKRLPATKSINLRKHETGEALKPSYKKAFEYSDCAVDDARLVILNAKDAHRHGAEVATRCKVVGIAREGGHWRLALQNLLTGERHSVTARLLVNAAGPWVDLVLAGAYGKNKAGNVRLVQGSHIVVPKLFEHDKSYIFQNQDDRVIFAIPYQNDFTLIGTTDRDFNGDPSTAKISEVEITYLCDAVSEYFQTATVKEDIVWTYAGVRPLYDDGASAAQEATRDYVIAVDAQEGTAPLLNIFGGKITTYRKLAEEILEHVEAALGGKKAAWTDSAPLPGGDFAGDAFNSLVADLQRQYPFLPADVMQRLAHSYGTETATILGDARDREALGIHFGAGLWQSEVDYLMAEEWAAHADDILWRRSKLGLRLSSDEAKRLQDYVDLNLKQPSLSAM